MPVTQECRPVGARAMALSFGPFLALLYLDRMRGVPRADSLSPDGLGQEVEALNVAVLRSGLMTLHETLPSDPSDHTASRHRQRYPDVLLSLSNSWIPDPIDGNRLALARPRGH